MKANSECRTLIGSITSIKQTSGYSEILQSFGIQYKSVEYHLQVGEITGTQGWILHLSVVLSQVQNSNLVKVIPLLLEENIAFKIPKDANVCDDLLIGNLGISQIGKIISIYPKDDMSALNLAKKLIELTQAYRGPAIPTDICLSNIVYTRYGGFAPIIRLDATGNKIYIYDQEGHLIKDSYFMPFQLPKSIFWPFSELRSISVANSKKLLKHIYKPISLLKADPRGNVYKGIYLKGLFNVKKCIIKQGYKYMNSDSAGRDIHDRLSWQRDLHNELARTVPFTRNIRFVRRGKRVNLFSYAIYHWNFPIQ